MITIVLHIIHLYVKLFMHTMMTYAAHKNDDIIIHMFSQRKYIYNILMNKKDRNIPNKF